MPPTKSCASSMIRMLDKCILVCDISYVCQIEKVTRLYLNQIFWFDNYLSVVFRRIKLLIFLWFNSQSYKISDLQNLTLQCYNFFIILAWLLLCPFLKFLSFLNTFMLFSPYMYQLTRSNILHWWIVDRVALSSFSLSFCLS